MIRQTSGDRPDVRVAIKGHFHGKVLVPDEPVDLPRGQRRLLHVQPLDANGPESGTTPRDAWDVLESLAGTVAGPSDWAAEHHHYLYGTPKRTPAPNRPR